MIRNLNLLLGIIKVQDLVEKIYNKVNEETTSANVAFLPGKLQNVSSLKNQIARLLKKKTKWNVEIIDEGINNLILFEDSLKISVPKTHYNEFNSLVCNISKKQIDLTNFLNEAISVEFDELITKFSTSFLEIDSIQQIKDLINEIKISFKDSSNVKSDSSILLDLNNYTSSLDLFLKEVNARYSKDTGYLERISNAIDEKLPLNSFGIFKDYSYLAGANLRYLSNNVDILFSFKVTLAYLPSQVIMINNKAILEEVSYYPDVKVRGTAIYPINSFKPSFISNLSELIRRQSNE